MSSNCANRTMSSTCWSVCRGVRKKARQIDKYTDHEGDRDRGRTTETETEADKEAETEQWQAKTETQAETKRY